MKLLKLLIGLAVLVTASVVISLALNQPPDKKAEEFIFSVPSGQTVQCIAVDLQRAELIKSRRFFILLARITGKEEEIKAGDFRLNTGMKTSQILKVLSSGQVLLQQFTVPEGLHIRQVALLLEDRGVIQSQSFVQACSSRKLIDEYDVPFDTLEGFLFPDTYVVAKGLGAEEIIRIMVERFFERLGRIKPPPYTDQELKQGVIIASLVEREAMVDEERPLVAAVFYNRLARNKRLESCATVQYILGKTKERLLHSDLRTPSPYNTYLHAGLPPGPIANPGAASLQAAFYPADVDYLFFVSRGNGTHHFSSTYEEHLRAIKRYNRGGAVGNQVS